MSFLRIGGRSLVALGAAGLIAVVGVLMPVSAHDAGAQHDWNAHLLPLAKESFFTKKQSKARFLEPCEAGTTPFGATIDVASLTVVPQDVNSLPESSAYNCTGLPWVATYSGDVNYLFSIEVPAGMFELEDLAFHAVALGDGMIANVVNVTIDTGTGNDNIELEIKTYRFADTPMGLSMTPTAPPPQAATGEIDIFSWSWGE